MGVGTSTEENKGTNSKSKNAKMKILEEAMEHYNIGVGEGKGILVENLKKHVEQLHLRKTDKTGFQYFFELIEGYSPKLTQELQFTAAHDPKNKKKNRYTNVLAPDHTRVKLSVNSNDESDYINASFVDGIIKGSEKAYIATQGPLDDTIEDFWHMVWDQKTSVVVMLTKVFENLKAKCAKYWPDPDESVTFGEYTVKCKEEREEATDFTLRRLTIRKQGESKSRKVVQIQYTGWPDYGLPEDIGVFLDIIACADTENTQKTPIVVHCSAGIGRSGTFCVVHTNMEMLRKSKKQSKKPPLNLLETILHFRKQRSGMVQTMEQAQFCYLALLEGAEKRLNYKMN